MDVWIIILCAIAVGTCFRIMVGGPCSHRYWHVMSQRCMHCGIPYRQTYTNYIHQGNGRGPEDCVWIVDGYAPYWELHPYLFHKLIPLPEDSPYMFKETVELAKDAPPHICDLYQQMMSRRHGIFWKENND